jgi:uncharacterized radical SAM superfamily protein
LFKIFHPGNAFPAISLSGAQCELDCAHCGKHYIKHMLSADSPDKLMKICEGLAARHAIGALISGGCNSYGRIEFTKYFDTLSIIKKRFDLVLNVHTGLITRETARRLVKTGIDAISIDVVGDSNTIKIVYGLDHRPEDIQRTLIDLYEVGIKNIIPHICIGLDYGQVKGEVNAIDMLSVIEPTALVFIVLIPTKGSKMEHCQPPSINEVISVIEYARSKYKNLPIYLGCMRPRSNKYRDYNHALELRAYNAGISGIVLPSKALIEHLNKHDIKIERYSTCCAVIR